MNIMHMTLIVSLLATTGLPTGPEAQVVLPNMVAEVWVHENIPC